MTRWLAVAACAALTACGHAPVRQPSPPPTAGNPSSSSATTTITPAESHLLQACAPTRQHHDSDYTAGGLYLPGVPDSGPAATIDVSGVREPIPRAEPLALTGNRTPYTVLGRVYRVLPTSSGYRERGVASWYGEKLNGRGTSSGETYDICSFTAAHKTLPLPSFVRVTNLDNGLSLIVRVNDRGPFQKNRLIDLSYAAAVRLGVDRTGTARVEVRSLDGADGDDAAAPLIASTPSPPPQSSAQRETFAGGSGRHLLQVGSFANKDNAKRLARRLEDADIDDVDIDHSEASGRDVWRVQIGPVKDRKIAALLDKIRALGLPNPRVFSE